MQLSSNEKELLAVDDKGLIQFWDINLIKTNFYEKDGFILKSSDSQIKFISFFKNGEMLASASEDQKVTLWNVIEQKVLATIEISFPITYLAINKTYEFLICVQNKSESQNFSVWNIENINQPYLLRTSSKYQINNILFTTEYQQSIENLDDTILIQNISNILEQEEYYQMINCTCIDFSPDENLIAISNEKQISLWSLQTNTPITSLENDSLVYELKFIEQGKKLLSGNYKEGVKLWSMEKCQLINFFQISYTQNITISSNYDRMAIKKGGQGQEIVIISLNQPQFKSIDFHRYNYSMNISISQNDKLFVSKTNNLDTTCYVSNFENNKKIEFEKSQNNFKKCVFSHQSSLFASFNNYLKLHIWTYKGLKFYQKHEAQLDCIISFMIFSFDDKYLAMESITSQLLIWDFSSNKIYTQKESINKVGFYNYFQSPEICFSCDSPQVAFYKNNEITIWEFLSDQTATIFKDDNSKIRIIASSPKQNIFATSSDDLTIKFWNFETKQLQHSFFTGEQTNCLCFTYDGKYLISARNLLKLWDISNLLQIKLCAATDTFQGENVETICCLHQTQGLLCCSFFHSEVIQFDQFKYLGVLESSDQSQIQCQFSADSRFLVGGIGKKVVIWNNDYKYEIVFSFPLTDIIKSLTFCQDQERLVVTFQSGIYILNIKSSNILKIIPNLNSAFYAKMFYNDEYLYTKQNQSVKIWRNYGDNQFTLIDYYSMTKKEQIVFSQDGQYLAILQDDYSNKSIIVYPVDLISKRRFILTQDVNVIRISNNSQYLLYGNYKLSKLSNFESDFTIEEFTDLGQFEFCPDNENIVFQNYYVFTLYNIKSKKIISQLRKDKDYYISNSFSFTNYDKILVDANEQIILFNIADINKPQLIGTIQDKITSVYPTTSYKYLASIVGENSIQITDMIQRKFIKSIQINTPNYYKLQDLVILLNDTKVAYLLNKQFILQNLIDDKIENNYFDTKECDKIAISKDRKKLIFSSGNQVYFYENTNHQEFNKLEENIIFLNFSFSQDSKYLAACGTNNTIYFWDFKARKVMAKFEGHSEKVNAVQISYDNSTLASCSDDKLIRLWNLNANFNRITQDGHENRISNIMFSADSLLLYSSGAIDYTLKLWDMEHKALLISKTFDYQINSFSITQNQDYLIITQGGKVEFWNIQYNQAFQKSLFEIIPGGCPSYNFTIKGSIQQIQFLSNDKQFITLTMFSCHNDQKDFSLAEIWERNDKIDESAILYEYDEIEIRLYQISQDSKYICIVNSNNELTLGELQIESKPNLTKLKQYNTDQIINLLFSNDSKILSSVDSQIVVFRILDGDQLLFSFHVNIEPENFFQYFTDDDKFYYTNFKNQIYLWDINQLQKEQNFQISQLELDLEKVDIQYFTISNTLKNLVIGLNDSQNNNFLRVLELNSMTILKNIRQNSKIQLLLFSDDDMLLALANELNEILVYEINQFTIKHSFQCHQAQIIKMQFFFYKEPQGESNDNIDEESHDNLDEQSYDNLDDQSIQIESNEQENPYGQPNQFQKINQKKKNIIYKSILSLISFDKNYSIVINYLDSLNTKNQTLKLPKKSYNQIQQVVFSKDIQTLAVITYDNYQDFQCIVYIWIKNNYKEQKKIIQCRIVDFCFDQNYLVYCNKEAELYLQKNYQQDLFFSEKIKINYCNSHLNEPFNYLKISSSKSIIFAGNNQYLFCQKFYIEQDQVKLILLKKIEYNNFNYSSMFLRQDYKIFCLKNNNIIKLEFLDAIEKLQSCLNYYSQQFEFTNCSFSSDLSLCVSVGQVPNCYDSNKKHNKYKYLILWNVRTLKYQTLLETVLQERYEAGGFQRMQSSLIFINVAVFIPNKKIIISNKDGNIEFRDCQDFNSITIIETLNNKNRIENLIVSKDGKLLISICEVGIFKLWNISQISQITLLRVIYYKEDLVHFRFTNDIFCYNLYQKVGKKSYYLEQLNLKKYSAKYVFQSLQQFITFSIMYQETIIAFGGEQLVLWNYKSNQSKIIIKKNNELFSQIFFGNNSNNLAAARGCVIYLIKEVTEALDFSSIQKLKGHEGKIVCLSILHDNQMIVSGSQDKTIRFWSIKQLATVYILRDFIEIISKITLSPNCKDMALSMEDGSIRLFELQFPENIHDLKLDEINNQSDYVHCYKVFGRQCLISAKNCILSDTIIEQDGKSLETLFIQKAAIKADKKKDK